jgi:2-haloacid dehalogenase
MTRAGSHALGPDRVRALTFDCYGTLIDWESGILSAVRAVLDARGRDLDDDSVLRLHARLESDIERGEFRTYRSVLLGVMDGFGRELGFVPDARERTALADSIGTWPLFADTVPSLRALKERYGLGVVSNVDDDIFAMTAATLGVPFDWVVTAQHVGAYKPSPRMFEAAIERIALPREAILHVAQSAYHDVAPARALGLATVLVRRRGCGATPPSGAAPDIDVPDLAALVSVLGIE